MKQHQKICKPLQPALINDPEVPFLTRRRVNRPVRVAASRGRERMTIWSSRLNDNHVDWFDEDDLSGVEIVEETNESSAKQYNQHVSTFEHNMGD